MRIRRALALMLAVLLGMLCGAQAAETMIEGPLQTGDSGVAVTRMQERLIELGYLQGEASGVFDAATAEAVMLFQEENELLATGIADQITLDVLMSEEAASYHVVEFDWLAEEEADGMAYSMANGMVTVTARTTGMPAAVPGYGELSFHTDEYSVIRENGFVSTRSNPLSTFAADVDTSSYAQMRRRILAGEAVPVDSVRIEEMLNYFSYQYNGPEGADPLGVTMELADCPWNPKTKLLQIGLQAKAVTREERQPLHLVFLIDTSGSMAGEDRLELVKRAFLLLLEELEPTDTVSIVAYASMDTVVLEEIGRAHV